jgi:arylsulfatase A-like enzyme
LSQGQRQAISRVIGARLFLAALLLGVFCSCAETEGPAAEPAPELSPEPLPNIVLILADDMGIGDVGAYNPESKIPTPRLDSLAASGMRFTDAHSASGVCTPTRYSLLTGRYSWRTSLKAGVLKGYSPLLIDPARPTIASMLRESGYATAAIGKWHLGLGDQEVTDYSKPLTPGPNDVGFDYFFGIPASLDMAPYVFVENEGLLTPFEGDQVEYSERRKLGGEGYWHAGPIARDFRHVDVLPETAARAVAWIRAQAGAEAPKPFFLYVPLSAPHTPWMPTPEFLGSSEVGYYGDFVVQVDDTVGRIMDALEETGLSDHTIVVFASDNGSRWEPADTEKWKHASNLHYRGMKADIFEGGHRVPLIVSWPGQVPAGAENGFLAGLTDLYATFAEATGAGSGEADGEDSISILPTLLGRSQAPHAVVHHSSRGVFAVREGDWKLIEGLGSGGFTKPAFIEPEPGGPIGQLYNLAEDPAETANLYLERPDVVERLTRILDGISGEDRSLGESSN